MTDDEARIENAVSSIVFQLADLPEEDVRLILDTVRNRLGAIANRRRFAATFGGGHDPGEAD